jgi:hypothetical protein
MNYVRGIEHDILLSMNIHLSFQNLINNISLEAYVRIINLFLKNIDTTWVQES